MWGCGAVLVARQWHRGSSAWRLHTNIVFHYYQALEFAEIVTLNILAQLIRVFIQKAFSKLAKMFGVVITLPWNYLKG